VLWGDSHGGQWFPPLDKLADDGFIYLDVKTRTTCLIADAPGMWNEDHARNPLPQDDHVAPNPTCDGWRAKVLARIIRNPPELVIISTAAELYQPYMDDWDKALTRLINKIPEETRVIVMSDTPGQAFDPVSCLARHINDALACATPRDKALHPESAKLTAAGAAAAGADYFDLTDYFCSSVCPVLQGDTIMYHDFSHLSASGSRPFAPLFRAEIAKVLGK
jgi:hypothetical protein